MSDAANTIAQKPAARKAASRKASNARANRFSEAEARVKANYAPTLEAALLLVPDEDRIARIVSHFGIEAGDADELTGLGSNVIRDLYETLAPILSYQDRDGINYGPLKLHLDRIVDGFVRSACGAANFYEGKRLAAKDAKDAFSNEYRDEDRMGIDGGQNRVDRMVRIAAENGVKAWAITCQASGACAAYKELMGEDWKPYVANNRRSVSEQAAAAQADALGI